jgi:hypothetical protein
MRSRTFTLQRFRLAAGAVVAAACILAPGVVPAEEPAPPAACMERPDAASSCQAPEADRSRAPQSRPDAARLQERLRAELADGEPPVVLNGRGYNYEAERDPGLEVQRLLREAQQQRRGAPRAE